jgi:predicted metal-dependent hydrolase
VQGGESRIVWSLRPLLTVPPHYQDLNRGIDLFNCARFFDAHEELEDVWRSLPFDGPSRRHVQGMVQLAVAFHHESAGNLKGARSVLTRALHNLDGADISFPELDLVRLRAELAHWLLYLNAFVTASDGPDVRCTVAPDLPKISQRR